MLDISLHLTNFDADFRIDNGRDEALVAAILANAQFPARSFFAFLDGTVAV